MRVANWAKAESGQPASTVPDIRVFVYVGKGAGADSEVLVVMHGVGRDADRYIREWVPVADEHSLIVVAPEFSRGSFPGALNYNMGGVRDENGNPRPRAVQSYAAIEPIFDAVVAAKSLNAKQYTLYGHSAGSQFVHRFLLTGHGERVKQAIAANAGSYAFPDKSIEWPWGIGGVDGPVLSETLSRPVTVLIGLKDNDPDYPSLPRDPGAMAQGPHRLARGQAFFSAAQAAASALGQPLGWRCALAPGLGHDNALAGRYAMELVTGRQTVTPGTNCATLSDIR
jgi:poly(3-hydroxybutyrate) depolymerase